MKIQKYCLAILLTIFFLLINNHNAFADKIRDISKGIYIGGWDCPTKRTNEKPEGNYCRLPHRASEENLKKLESVKQFIAINLRGITADQKCSDFESYLEAAELWSLLSLRNKNIVILTHDDFVAWWIKCTKRNVEIFSKTKAAINKHNKKLLYGITFYETDFDKLTDNALFAMGEQIDVLHFYLHRRSNVKNYGRYVSSIKKYFPNAKIIFGVYNYDRRNYEKRYDNDDMEKTLFVDQLNYCYKKLRTDNSVLGIEFYPGSLGEPQRLLMRDKLIGDENAKKITTEINAALENWLLDLRNK